MSKGKRNRSLDEMPVLGVQSQVREGTHRIKIGGASLEGSVPVLLVHVRATNIGLKQFARACGSRGVYVRPCDPERDASVPTLDSLRADVAEYGSATFECFATAEALMYLMGHPSVVSASQVVRATANVRGRVCELGWKRPQRSSGGSDEGPSRTATDAELGRTVLPVPGAYADKDRMGGTHGAVTPDEPHYGRDRDWPEHQ